MTNAPPNKWVPLLILTVLWGGFGLFAFVQIHLWGVANDAKIEKIASGKAIPELFEVLKINSDGDDTAVTFRRAERPETVIETGDAHTIHVGDAVKAYRFDNDWFIPEIHRGGHHWGKWIFLAFGLIPPLIAWVVWRAKYRDEAVSVAAAAPKESAQPQLASDGVEVIRTLDVRRLYNRPHRGRPYSSTFSIISTLLCSVILMIGTAGIAWFKTTTDSTGTPEWVFYLFVGFALFGFPAVAASIKGIASARRFREMRAQFPQEPWKADYDWHTEGIWDESGRALRSFVATALMSSVFITPFFFIATAEGSGLTFFLCLFSLIPLYCAGKIAYMLLRRSKFGRSYIRFESFPFYLGEDLRVAWRPGKPMGAFQSMTFTLRCIEEQTIKSGDGETEQQFAELFEQTISIAEPGEKNDTVEVPLVFQPPLLIFPLGTQFTSATPRYWELEVRANTPGIKYAATFMVPVYARVAGAPVIPSVAALRG